MITTITTAPAQATRFPSCRRPAPAITTRTSPAAWRSGKRRISARARNCRTTASQASLISTRSRSAFVEGFAAASDPTSFLRLANVPFETTAADGSKLVLLRVEADFVTDVGSIMPHLGGETFRYDPLPAKLVTRRRRLRFIYRDENGIRALSFAEVRALART